MSKEVIVSKLLSDQELYQLTTQNILVEGLNGLVKVDHQVQIKKDVKLRIGSAIMGQSIIEEKGDIGLAGGSIIYNSQIGPNCAITGGGKVFNSICGSHLRNYGSIIKNSNIGSNFIIRSMGEVKDINCKNNNKLQMFSRVYSSALGNFNVIGAHSSVSDATIGDKNIIGDYSKLEKVHIGNNNKIGAYVHIISNKNKPSTVIGHSCIIESHVTIQPGTRIPDRTKIPQHSVVFLQDDKTVVTILSKKMRSQLQEDKPSFEKEQSLI